MTAELPDRSGQAPRNGLQANLEQFATSPLFATLPSGFRGTALRSAERFINMPADELVRHGQYAVRIPEGDPLAQANGTLYSRADQSDHIRRLMIADGVEPANAERDALILLRASLAVDAARSELNLAGIRSLTDNERLCLELATEAVFHVENSHKYPSDLR